MAATPEARIIDAMAQVVGEIKDGLDVIQLATQPERPDPSTVYLVAQGSEAVLDTQRIGNTYGPGSSGYEKWTLTIDLITLARRDPCNPPRWWRRKRRTGTFSDATLALEADPFASASETPTIAWAIEEELRKPWHCSPAFVDQENETDEEKAENSRIRTWLSLSGIDAKAIRIQWSNTEKDRIVVLNQTWQVEYQRFSAVQERGRPDL